MTDILDHAVTIRDVLYVLVVLVILVGWLGYISHPLIVERKRIRQAQKSENHRNPVYGVKR